MKLFRSQWLKSCTYLTTQAHVTSLQFKQGSPVWQEERVCQSCSVHTDEQISIVTMLETIQAQGIVQ